jgi:putative addiction module killer protein
MDFEIEYFTLNGNVSVFRSWLLSIRDNVAKRSILTRVARLQAGNFGYHRNLQGGIGELKIDVGAGYRVYYSVVDKKIILLLCGGNKKSQDTDISTALSYLNQWKVNKKEN